jgi:hypothetical protein
MPIEALVAILLVGVVGGYLGGIVGAGIGATVVPGLILLGVDPVIAIGSSLLLHVLIAPIGGISHYKFGHVRWKIFAPLVLAGVLGAFLGANISMHLPAEGLKLFVGASTIAAGLLITVRYPRANQRKLTLTSISKRLRVVSAPMVVSIALIAGLSHGALGTGWGPLGVSLLILVGVLPHTAVGSSLLARSFVALAGASTYYFLGSLRIDVVLPLLAGGAIAILLGALTAKRLPPRTLKLIVGATVIVLGASVLIKQVI